MKTNQSKQEPNNALVGGGGNGVKAAKKYLSTPLSFVTLSLALSSGSSLSVSPKARLITPGSRPVGDSQSNVDLKRTREPHYVPFAGNNGSIQEHNSAMNGVRTKVSGWISNVFSPPTPDEEEAVVDEYLEFLDRRYHRLNDDETAPTSAPSKQFSTWDWLMQKESSHDAQQAHDDALFVLGVAELASERLLQKHHIPIEAVTPSPAPPVIEAKASTMLTATHSKLFVSPSAGTSVLERVMDHRRALIKFQEKQIKRVASASIKATVKAPVHVARTALALWRHAGGKKSFALTLSMLTAAFLLVRPAMAAVGTIVFESVLTES